MRLINTRLHGILDYCLGLILITSPWIFHFEDVFTPKMISLCSGASLIVLNIFSCTDTSLKKIIPLKIHLLLDVLIGLFLLSSPWLLQFFNHVFKPHLVFGIAVIAISVLTDRIPLSKLQSSLRQ